MKTYEQFKSQLAHEGLDEYFTEDFFRKFTSWRSAYAEVGFAYEVPEFMPVRYSLFYSRCDSFTWNHFMAMYSDSLPLWKITFKDQHLSLLPFSIEERAETEEAARALAEKMRDTIHACYYNVYYIAKEV